MGQSVLTADFTHREGALWCEGVSLERIAEEVGTPAYVYGAGIIREQYARLEALLASVPHRIHYSIKANSNTSILRLIGSLGGGVDVVSGGELHRARRAGFGGDSIIFGGVGKSERELREALDAGVLLLNVESEGELRLVDRIAGEMHRVAPVALRVNPEVTVETPHGYTRTGGKGDKFGIPVDDAPAVARLASELPHVRLAGLDMHIGSQVARVDSYRDALLKLMGLYDRLRRAGLAGALHHLDIGGGLAVTYAAEEPTDLAAFAEAVLPAVSASGLTLIMEPGRFLVGNAGVLLSRVLYRKRSGGREYVIIDAGMTELLRPSHYNAYHHVEAVRPRGQSGVFDIVGPVCESGDFFALARGTDALEVGDLAAVRSAGAYGFVMSSTYNSRPRVPEVLVDGDRFAVISERERYEDLVAREPLTPEWRAG